MAGKSNIEWTEQTWNPIVGCSILTPGCTNCYAMKMAARLKAMGQELYAGLTKSSNAGAVWTGNLKLAPEHTLLAPLRRKKPTTYFVNSMGDLFHEDAPDEWIDKVWAVMALSPQHMFQVLTKRAERMRDYFAAPHPAPNVKMWQVRVCGALDALVPERHDASRAARHAITNLIPLVNVWLGVSAERQKEADERIPLLLQTPAAVRFVSCEPLLGALDLTTIEAPDKVEGERWTFNALKTGDYYTQWSETMMGEPRGSGGDGPHREHAIDWVICGGESGPNARPMHPGWARKLRDDCAESEVPFFFKQWGEWAPHKVEAGGDLGGDVRAGRVRIVHPSGRSEVEIYQATGGHNTERGSRYMARVGRKSAGRTLDSSLHSDMPRGRNT